MTTLLITSFLLLLLCSFAASASGNVVQVSDNLGEVTNESLDLDLSYSYSSEPSKDDQEGSLWLCKSTCPDDPARAKQKCNKACEKKYGRPPLSPRQQCMAKCRTLTIKDDKKACKKDCRLKYKQKACLTRDQCEAQSKQVGFGLFYEGVFPTKGCFTKETKYGHAVFFSKGSLYDMSTSNLSGKKERLWCTKNDEA